MHFSIPETQELYDEETTYTGYKIYINGNYHCCLRYKQLHALHEQLRKLNIQLPSFPPKRFLPLTNSQLRERRSALEHYLQLVGQDSQISKLDQFQKFLLSAQQETALAEGILDDYDDFKRKTILEIHLMNDYQLQVNCFIGDNASCVLRKACQNLKLTENMMQYFSLFMVRKDSKNNVILLRRLMDFESPYLSRLQDVPCQIMLRKSYWNSSYDLKLQLDPIVLNLLFIQTVSDIDHEWIIASPDVRPKLRSLQEHGLKKEYLELARQLPLYGCLQFSAANIDYPEPQSSALISIGNKELSIRTAKASKIFETKFRVTRMRCWRVSALHSTALDSKQCASNLQLSFEYLMSKQNMRWITITSSQAMLMSVCLQQMVDELLSTRLDDSQQDINVPISPPLSYVPRTGRFSQSSLSSSSSTPSFSNEQATSASSSTSSSTCSPTTGPVTFISQCDKKQNTKISSSKSYSAVFFRNAAQQESVHNQAFEGIGDDDL